MSLASAADIGFGQSGFDITPQTLGEVVGFAKLMSTAQHAIPAHLRDNAGACMAVTLQALGWQMSPFAVAQKSYKVGDTIAYEAQLIAAVVNSRAGFKVRPEIDFTGEGPTRQCTVTFTFKNGDVRSYTSPEVGKITTKNSPLWRSDQDQQLSYFSLRSAARRHCPEVILGVMDRDEVENAEPLAVIGQGQGTGMVERLKARAQPTDVDPAGFNVRTITEETAAAKPKRAKKADAPPAEAAQADPHDETIVDAEVEEIPPSASAAAAAAIDDDDLPEGLKERPTETANVQNADAGPASSASATDASTGSAAEASGEAQASDERSSDSDNPDDVQEGCAAPGDLYYHTDLPQIGGDGHRAAFKDGVFFSRLSPRDDLLIYDQHAPLVSQLTQAEPEETINAADINALGGAIGEFWTKMQATTSWLQIKKPLLTDLNASDDFNELEDDEKDALRAKIVEFVRALKPADPVDQAQDATFFRCWVCTQHGPDGADAIEGTLQILKREPIWQKVGEALEPIAKAHIARCKEER